MIKTRRFSGPSLTPMIDVVFLLLLFFLLSSQLKTEQILEMEIANGADQPSSTDIQLVEIGENLLLNGLEITEAQFISYLDTLEAKQTTFAIRSDQDVTYGKVVKLVDQIRAMGFAEVVLVENTNEN